MGASDENLVAPIPKVECAEVLSDPRFRSCILLDVRTPQEWMSGHLPNAQHLPLQILEQGALPEIPASSTIVVYCKSGVRSQRAIRILQAQGFQNLFNLTGGILAWTGEISTDPT